MIIAIIATPYNANQAPLQFIHTKPTFIYSLIILNHRIISCAKFLIYMKHLLLAFSFFLFIGLGSASAQTEKGFYYIGGSLSYDFNSYGSSTTYDYAAGYTIYNITNVYSFSISPEFGYFLSKKWSIGIQPTYARTGGTETSNYYSYTTAADNFVSSDKYHNDIFGIGITLRYYCMITDKFGFFPQFGISTLNNVKYPNYGTLAIGVSPNFVFFPTNKIGVNLGFGNLGYNLDYKTKQHTLNAGLDDKISFGLNYYWGRK